MSDPVIQHWERVMHKNVRTSDRIDAGNIISEAGENCTIPLSRSSEIWMSSSSTISSSDLMNYKVQ
jgi:hypothetical protein